MAEKKTNLEKELDKTFGPIWDIIDKMTPDDVFVEKTWEQNILKEFNEEFNKKVKEGEKSVTGFKYEYSIQDKNMPIRAEFIASIITNYFTLVEDIENKNINIPGLARIFDEIMKTYYVKKLGKGMDEETYKYVIRRTVQRAYDITHGFEDCKEF